MKYFLKYNKLKLDVQILRNTFEKELEEKLLKINDLELEQKEYRKKLTAKNKHIRELKEIIKGGQK